jgi:hypothetical protein
MGEMLNREDEDDCSASKGEGLDQGVGSEDIDPLHKLVNLG